MKGLTEFFTHMIYIASCFLLTSERDGRGEKCWKCLWLDQSEALRFEQAGTEVGEEELGGRGCFWVLVVHKPL